MAAAVAMIGENATGTAAPGAEAAFLPETSPGTNAQTAALHWETSVFILNGKM